MVIQRSWKDASQQNSSSEDSNGSWQFQPPGKVTCGRSASTQNMSSRPPINRQLAINALAAMHRRYNFPGSLQPHSRPVAEFRASANKSLDILRQTIQSAVTKEIDQVIKKYLEKFFVPAVNNIRSNLGDDSVSEDQVRAVCRAMLDATRTLYATPPRAPVSPCEMSDSESSNGADSRFGRPTSSPSYSKRKESDTDSDVSNCVRRKKIKQEEQEVGGNSESACSSPSPTVNRDPDKWNPERLKDDTLFIMGSHAHRVLGMGSSRGRLYTKHADLMRYPADSADKEWIASHNLMNSVGGKTYIMVLEDIEELAASDSYRQNALPMLAELTGFRAPPFMLRKIKAFLAKRVLANYNSSTPNSPQPSTSGLAEAELKKDMEEVKSSARSHLHDLRKDEYSYIKLEVDDKDDEFDDIKMDGVKIENIDDIKVEDIEDFKEIKVEDIKLENEDSFDICKQSDDDNSQIVGLLDSDIDFLSRNLGNLENEADARKTIEKLTGANPDTLTLVGDEFDFGSALNTTASDGESRKCITVASTTSGLVHAVPVAHIARLTQRSQGIPINTSFTTLTPQSSSGVMNVTQRNNATATVLGNTIHYVTPKNFSPGNILHNAIVSRNVIARSASNSSAQNFSIATTVRPITVLASDATLKTVLSQGCTSPSSSTTNYSAVRPVIHTTMSKITLQPTDYDNISTTKDMIDNACNSSMMLKKVLTLGSGAKSFVMHNTQKILSGLKETTAPPNVTIVSSNVFTSASTSLSATHATLSALLSGSAGSSKQSPKKTGNL